MQRWVRNANANKIPTQQQTFIKKLKITSGSHKNFIITAEHLVWLFCISIYLYTILCCLYMASFIFQQNYIVLGAHLLSLWCSNQCLHTDHGRYLHCQHTLLLIANQVTNRCWIKNKQNLFWCHKVLDHQVNKTKHVSIWKRLHSPDALKDDKIFTNLKASMLYGVLLWTIFIFL